MRLHDENASFRLNQTGLKKFLGDLECEVMELIWKKSGSTVCVRDIYAGLSRGRSIAYTTVMTTMMRLAEKGLLKVVDHVGLANYYSPVCSRKEFISKAVFIVLQSFAKDFPEVTATGLKNIKFPARTHRKY